MKVFLLIAYLVAYLGSMKTFYNSFNLTTEFNGDGTKTTLKDWQKKFNLSFIGIYDVDHFFDNFDVTIIIY